MKNIEYKNELETKYLNKKNDVSVQDICNLFENNGFEIISTKEKQNFDEYYDTKELELFYSKSSLRIREVGKKYKGTYKRPTGVKTKYTSRNEIEEPLKDKIFENFQRTMQNADIPIDFDKILKFPIVNVQTNRVEIIVEKNNEQISIALDKSRYTNSLLNNTVVTERMVEIESISNDLKNSLLDEIHISLSQNYPNLELNKQSKYERAIMLTLAVFYNNNEIDEMQAVKFMKKYIKN